jgi:hypothetical protein
MKNSWRSIGLAIAIAALSATGLNVAGNAETPAPATAAKKVNKVPKGVVMLYNGQNFEGVRVEIDSMRTSIVMDYTVGSIGIAPGESWTLCDGERFKGTCNTYTESQTGLGKVMIRSAKFNKVPKAPKAAKAAK